MYNLLIVDDEFLVKEGLKKLINWDKFGIKIIGEASNGHEGLSLAKNLKPDIIITDIKMPDMTGLDMIKIISEQCPSIFFIVLSGYDDFEWAKRAFKYGVVDYLLKPVDFQQLDSALEKAIKNIELERSNIESKEKINNVLNKSIAMLKKEALIKLLEGPEETNDNLKEQLEYAKVNFDSEQCAVLLLRAKEKDEQETGNTENTYKEIYNSIFLWLESKKFGYGVSLRDEKVAFILDTQETSDKWIFMLAEYIQDKFLLSKYDIVLGVGNVYKGLNNIKNSYIEAEQAVQYWYLSNKSVVFYSEIQCQLEKLEKIAFPHRIEESVIEGLKLANRDVVEKSLQSYYDQISQKKIEILYFKNICIEFLFGIKRELARVSIDLTKIFNDIFKEIYAIESKDSIEEIWDSVRLFINKIMEFSEHTKNTSSKQVVHEIMLYIEENYATSEISLNEIAERIYLTPNYISMLIKQETGENFSDIVVRKRMEKAKEFLFDVTMKTYEIAEKVGYSDPNYFSRTFKKAVGMSPGDFRNKFCS